ncbi:metallophosphoesterase family protein [Guggenheimella bovis]
MRSKSRLDAVYEQAPVEIFNDESKYVIMSDMHRGDSSFSDEFAPNQNIFMHAANYYYNNNFTFIENGDGDELWEHSKFEYIYWAHQDVFDIYKKFHEKNRLRIIYGNHNITLKYREVVKKTLWESKNLYTDEMEPFLQGIVPQEGLRLRYEDLGKEILILHGHQGDALNDTFWRVAHFLLRYVWRFLHVIGMRNPQSPAKSAVKRHKIEKMYERWMENKDLLMIVGHTHRPRFAKPESKSKYFNTGSAVRPQIVSSIEIVGGTISLVHWRTRVNAKGLLQVTRKIVDGPIALSKYF